MLRSARTPDLTKFYILSDKEGFAMELWLESFKENKDHVLCFAALGNILLHSTALGDGFLSLITENKIKVERLILWIDTL